MNIDDADMKIRDPAYKNSWEVAIYDQLNRINLPRRRVMATHVALGQLPHLHYAFQADRPIEVYGVGAILWYRDEEEPIGSVPFPQVNEFVMRAGQTVTITIPLVGRLNYGPPEQEKKLILVTGTARPVGVLKDMLKKPKKDCIKEFRQYNADHARREFKGMLERGEINKDQHQAITKELKKRLKQDHRPRGM